MTTTATTAAPARELPGILRPRVVLVTRKTPLEQLLERRGTHDQARFYLQSRGLTGAEASSMIVSGFIEPLIKELPMEYAVEMNRLIELQMEGSVG